MLKIFKLSINIIKLSPIRSVIIFVLLLTLPSCAQKANLPCPSVSIIDDASIIHTYLSEFGQDVTDIKFETYIQQVNRVCKYKNNQVTVNSRIKIISKRGPRNNDIISKFDFVVAVLDKENNILARKKFTSTIKIDEISQRGEVIEDIEQVIPIRNGQRGMDYKILFGFELTPTQLMFNRNQKMLGILKRLP
ncbi:hypothetical protein OAK17_06510 [Alphaproteobacteria bacterium]|nr:hypothetical protein [Alphaproteobacteria bacterium]